MDRISIELWSKICEYLPIEDIHQLSSTCTYMHRNTNIIAKGRESKLPWRISIEYEGSIDFIEKIHCIKVNLGTDLNPHPELCRFCMTRKWSLCRYSNEMYYEDENNTEGLNSLCKRVNIRELYGEGEGKYDIINKQGGHLDINWNCKTGLNTIKYEDLYIYELSPQCCSYADTEELTTRKINSIYDRYRAHPRIRREKDVSYVKYDKLLYRDYIKTKTLRDSGEFQEWENYTSSEISYSAKMDTSSAEEELLRAPKGEFFSFDTLCSTTDADQYEGIIIEKWSDTDLHSDHIDEMDYDSE